MKRYIKEYAKAIQKEVKGREVREKVQRVLNAKEKELITDRETMFLLTTIHI